MTYAWYQDHDRLVPPRQWTALRWQVEGTDHLGLTVAADGLITPPTGYLYDLDIEVAFENNHSHPMHRRKVRYRHSWFPWVSADVNSSITDGTDDDDIPQTILCNMQPNDVPFYIEVYHTAPFPIRCCRFGVEAPSLMIAQLGRLR